MAGGKTSDERRKAKRAAEIAKLQAPPAQSTNTYRFEAASSKTPAKSFDQTNGQLCTPMVWVRSPAGPSKHGVAAVATRMVAWSGHRRKALSNELKNTNFKGRGWPFPVSTLVVDAYDSYVRVLMLQGPQAAIWEVAPMLGRHNSIPRQTHCEKHP